MEKQPLTRRHSQKHSPEVNASWVSNLFFCWLAPLFKAAGHNELTKDAVFPILDEFKNDRTFAKWLECWTHQRKIAAAKSTTIKTFWVLFHFAKWEWIQLILVRVAADVCHYVQPLLLKALLEAFGRKLVDVRQCLILAVCMFAASELRSLLMRLLLFRMLRIELRLRSAIVRHIYEKGTRLAPEAQHEYPVGTIMNLMSVDVEKLVSVIPFMHHFWSAPVQIAFATGLLLRTIGVSALPGVCVVLLYVPFNYYTSVSIKQCHKMKMRASDARLKQLEETVSGVETVKTHAWETAFARRIEHSRNAEVRMLRNANIFARAVDAANMALPFLVAVTTFGGFIFFAEGDLSPTKAFVSLAIFNKLRTPAKITAFFLGNLMQAMVANKRLKAYLESAEKEVGASADDEVDDPLAAPLSLKTKISELAVRRGERLAVVGAVGSGKSTFLTQILWREKCLSDVAVHGRVAYVPQKPWLPRGSIRSAIVFGAPWNSQLYEKVLDACELRPDLEQWQNGDQNMIYGQSSSLSGGQRARLSLARALYQGADLYLIDDVFSSLDKKVATKIMENLFGSNGMLQDAATVLVSSDVAIVSDTPKIAVFAKHEMVALGSAEELTQNCAEFARLSSLGDERHLAKAEEEPDEKARSLTKSSAKSMFETEEKLNNKKPTSWAVYKAYFSAASFTLIFGFLIAILGHFVFGAVRGFWLSHWTDSKKLNSTGGLMTPEEQQKMAEQKMIVFAGIGTLEVISIVIAYGFLVLLTERASRLFHKHFIESLLNTSMTMHRKIDVGQVMNRASRDFNTFDTRAPHCLRQMVQNILQILCSLVVIAITTPIFLFSLAPIVICYVLILKKYVPAMKQWSRVERALWSPVISQASEGMSGIEVIRSAGQEDTFSAQFVSEVDAYISAEYLENPLKRWLMLRLDLIGNSIVLLAAVFCVWSITSNSLTAGAAGLSISFAMTITEQLGQLVRMMADMETSMIAVERIKKYVDLEHEDKHIDPAAKPPLLSGGDIEWIDYAASYRKTSSLVLSEFSLKVKSGERVVVVGRTGSGKSSTFLSLLRMLEVQEGDVEIGGCSTSRLAVRELRRHCAVVPQAVRIFDDTVRFNVDPEGAHDDAQIWSAIESSGLRALVDWPQGLQQRLSALSMSHGQRQLVGVCRCLLQGGDAFAGCLLLDEPFASADVALQKNLERVLPRFFARATTFTITHKPPADGTYDRLIEISNGQLIAERSAEEETAAAKTSTT